MLVVAVVVLVVVAVVAVVVVAVALNKSLTTNIFGLVLYTNSQCLSAVQSLLHSPLPALYIFAENNTVVQKILDNTLSGGVCVNSAIEHILGTT